MTVKVVIVPLRIIICKSQVTFEENVYLRCSISQVPGDRRDALTVSDIFL